MSFVDQVIMAVASLQELAARCLVYTSSILPEYVWNMQIGEEVLNIYKAIHKSKFKFRPITCNFNSFDNTIYICESRKRNNGVDWTWEWFAGKRYIGYGTLFFCGYRRVTPFMMATRFHSLEDGSMPFTFEEFVKAATLRRPWLNFSR